MTSKLEYLQRYMGKGGETTEKKLRKKRKKDKSAVSGNGTHIVDADHDWTQELPARRDLEDRWGADAAEDEAPVIVANGEVDPEDLPVIANADEYEEELKASNEPKRDDDGNLSPPRRQRAAVADDDASPPRRKSQRSDDESPPRRGRKVQRSDEDASPPRRGTRKGDSDSDNSPPRRNRRDSEDASPPRRRRGSRVDDDESPPRRRPTQPASDDDESPPRRRPTRRASDDDASPPRRASKAEDRDSFSARRSERKTERNSPRARSRGPSPTRRSSQHRHITRSRSRGRRSRRHSRSSSRDRHRRRSPSKSRERSRRSARSRSRSQSRDRRNRQQRSSRAHDRRTSGRSDSQDSAVIRDRRRRNRSASESTSPPRRDGRTVRHNAPSSPRDLQPKESPEEFEGRRMPDKAGEKDPEPVKEEYKPRAGLFTAEEFADDLKRKAALNDMLKGASAEDMGHKAETVYRDKKGRKLDMLNELVRQQEIIDGKREREAKEEYEWGTGRVQKEEKRDEQELMKKIKDAPFARRADDAELEAMRRERVRAFDPINSKVFQEDNLFDTSSSKKSKKHKSKKHKSKDNSKPKYAGPPAPPNRFGIQPGYRWDGVVRGTGWEEKIMLRANTQNAQSDEAYRYAVADM